MSLAKSTLALIVLKKRLLIWRGQLPALVATSAGVLTLLNKKSLAVEENGDSQWMMEMAHTR